MSTMVVIMGNDFPECTFDDPALAEAYVAQKKAEKAKLRADDPARRVYWRAMIVAHNPKGA